ncbi:hypothetical protein EJ05DRAFT_500558 [Pseudovirgaria hyperparasitica]|uniref:DNA recombination and repair protein Rad51-like C-terminal domain-containing protein n=1 Tax=Pseudovirgaria hyperparasitica TaxID=470096 RepID=A0A6A6W587_9PEZI|nr:uncharacterized protein EJ05DRAFT_500558 [Pseudovirgaria hyperparasitica]KAF2758042.1 hypothetical protein EJ05DRAFT_500558 [Pseudovirgaria hyperparasitica]
MSLFVDPVLASTEYDDEVGVGQFSMEDQHVCGNGRIKTGHRELDEALNGGFSTGRGGIVEVAADVTGSDDKHLVYSILASHLVSNASSCVAIIDTTGNCDVLALYETLVAQFERSRPTCSDLVAASAGDAKDLTEKALERVKIFRAFDLTGVRESITEIQEGLRHSMGKANQSSAVQHIPLERRVSQSPHARKMSEIPDSQAEDGDHEMLLDPIPTVAQIEPPKESTDTSTSSILQKIDVLVVDNLTQVIKPLMKGNHVQAHAVLSSFLRTLNHLVTAHSLLALLMVSTVTPYSQALPRALTLKSTLIVHDFDYQREIAPVSIFASNAAYPTLGQSFPYFVDLMLLISRLPLDQRDARVFYADDVKRYTTEVVKGVRLGILVEVLKDRYEARCGRWAVIGES